MSATTAPSLADWMLHGLYDAQAGYYAAGRVRFGHGEDFWTFPTRLSPSFGMLLTEHLTGLRQRLVDGGDLAAAAPFYVIELGAGDGTLGRDLLDAAAADDADAGLAATLCYRVGERSGALRERQRTAFGPHADIRIGGDGPLRADHLPQRADGLLPDVAPFAGVILHNELLDVWPHELVRPATMQRLVLDAGDAFDRESLVGAMRAAFDAGNNAPPLTLTQRWAPLDDPAIMAWLAALTPWVDHRVRSADGAATTLVCPGMPQLTAWAAATLQAGWMLTIDYGGGCDHHLDPMPALPQLRLYPQPAAVAERRSSEASLLDLDWPGRQDVTVDIDFSHLAWCGAQCGLRPVLHGPQGLLAPGQALAAALGSVTHDALAPASRAAIERRLRKRHGLDAIAAAQLVYAAARGFVQRSAGFRLLLQERDGTRGALPALAGSWPVLPSELPALAHAPSDDQRAALDLPEGLTPARSLLSALDEAGRRDDLGEILSRLDAAGLLVFPGAAFARAADTVE